MNEISCFNKMTRFANIIMNTSIHGNGLLKLGFVLFLLQKIYFSLVVNASLSRGKLEFGQQFVSSDIKITLYGRSLVECVVECQTRLQCGYINYQTVLYQCELMKDTGTVVLKITKRNYVSSEISTWPKEWSGACFNIECSDNNTQCDVTTGACKVSTCAEPPTILFSTAAGTVSIGSMMRYTCKDGFQSSGSNVIATCNESGDWSTLDLECNEPSGWAVRMNVKNALWENTQATVVGLSRSECRDHCIATERCMSASYKESNGECVPAGTSLFDGVPTVQPIKGWEIWSRYFSVFMVLKQGVAHQISWPDASGVCTALGTSLAQLGDLHAAYNNGYQRCQCGWTDSGTAYKILQTSCSGFAQGVNPCTYQIHWNVFCKTSTDTIEQTKQTW